MSNRDDESVFQGDDELLFVEETARELPNRDYEPWKVMIVDDEEEIHRITHLVLDGFLFEGRGITYLNAYSGQEAMHVIRQNPDTALILLDVVMETEHSGLDVVRYIRRELKNDFVRIILRTGHPGQAPERKVITECDINDYKEKTELTAQKLFTTVTTALRSYRDLKIIEKNRKGLEQIIEASANLFAVQSLKQFAAGALTQLISILRLDDNSLYLHSSGFAATKSDGDYNIIAATGKYAHCVDKSIKDAICEEVREKLRQAYEQKKSLFFSSDYVGYFETSNGSENLLYVGVNQSLSDLDKHLIRIFSTNVSIALDNIYLNQEMLDTQKEVIFTLGEVIDNRSRETANHVRRVSEYSHLLALKWGMDTEEAEILRLASPMHDVGKMGIPDSILNKPGYLTPEEFEIIKTHPLIGYNILRNSKRRILKAASIIVLQHHERWDGKGYPQGLKGEEIHIYGRITCLADVFDALTHRRVYKEAWELCRLVEFLKEERGKHFDPRLVDLFLANLNDFIVIRDAYPDDIVGC